MNSYQKLKAENQKLIQDIHTLVTKEDTIDHTMVSARWSMKFHQEEAIMFGTTGPGTQTKGITGFIKMMDNPYSSCMKELADSVLNPKNYSIITNGLLVGVYYDGKIQETKKYITVSAINGIVHLRSLDAETIPNDIIIVPGMIGYEEGEEK